MVSVSEALQTAVEHHQAGNLKRAEAIYREIIRVDSSHADAMHLLGVTANQRRRHDVAVEYISRAIALLFPRARVIHCRRHPLDVCLSSYFQNFEYLAYSFDLKDVGRYYLLYERLMEHWQTAYPGTILDVEYEELVADQEAASRRLIECCGLVWDDRCLEFYRNERPVTTASLWQVRQPMYRSSVGRWKNYRKHLNPLMEILDGQERPSSMRTTRSWE